MEYTLFALFMILCVIAGIELIQGLVKWIFVSKSSAKSIIVFPVKGTCEDIEYIVRYLNWKCGNELQDCTDTILLVDMGADSETITLCRKLCEDYETVGFCKSSEIEKYLH